MTKPGKVLAMDESNATCGSSQRGVENEENVTIQRTTITTPDLGKHIGGAILFEETLYQPPDGKAFVDCLNSKVSTRVSSRWD